MPVPCSRCQKPTRDLARALHAACRPVQPSLEKIVVPPRPAAAAAQRSTAPPAPRVLKAPEVVGVDDLPRGPKAVAKKMAEGWRPRWEAAETEVLENPTRGGESVGLSFVHGDGRHGWAVWIRGKFAGAFLYPRVGALVPVKLSAAELKGVLADG